MIHDVFHLLFYKFKVTCVGQLIGAIVARDRFTAKKAAKAVVIEYEDIEPCILTIEVINEFLSLLQMY